MSNAIELLIKSSSSNAINSIKNMKNEISATRSEVTSFIQIIGKLGKKLYETTDLSDDYTASLRLLRTTLGETTDKATDFIRKLSEISGIDENRITKQTTKFVQMGESLNLSNEQAEKFSENLSILTTKLSMLYNIDYGTMGSNIQKALQGKPSSLTSQTGISIKEGAEEATLLAYGIDREVSSLNDAELALLKYATILRQVSSDSNVYQGAVNSLAWQKQVLTSQVRRLASAVGQLLSPAFTQLITILNGVLMVITEIITMLASLVGINVETADTVQDVSDNYNNLGASIGGAAAQAKKSLRAFDKLNNITTPTSGGGGGGAGGLGLDKSMLGLLDSVGDSFDKIKNKATEIRDKIMDWLGFTKDVNGQWKWSSEKLLKNIWNWWKELNALGKIFVSIGIAAVILKIVSALTKVYTLLKSKVLNVFKTLSSLASLGNKNLIGMADAFFQTRSAAQRATLAVSGLVAAFSGIMMIVSAVQKLKEEGASFNTILEIIIGTLALVGGAIVTVGAIMGGLSTTMALATGGISLLIGGIAALITWFATEKTQTEETKSSTDDFRESLEELNNTAEDTINKTLGQVDQAQMLKDKLLELVDVNGQINDTNGEATGIISNLNDLLGTEYEITGNQITLDGKLIRTKEELSESLEEYCVQLQAEAYLEAYRQTYIETMKRQIEIKKELKDREENINRAIEYTMLTTKKSRDEAIKEADDKIKAYNNLQNELSQNQAQINNYQNATAELAKGNYRGVETELLKETKYTKKTIDETMNDLGLNSNRTLKTIQDAVNEFNYLDPEITITVRADTSQADRAINNLVRGNTSIPLKIGGYASGGFPTEGELFMAREAGPELVGSINGHSAVANNDQIVKGIQSGVFSGMMSALSNANFGGNVVIEASGDTEGLMNFINFKQKQKDRQFN